MRKVLSITIRKLLFFFLLFSISFWFLLTTLPHNKNEYNLNKDTIPSKFEEVEKTEALTAKKMEDFKAAIENFYSKAKELWRN
ncbi:hypothetical protein WAX74_14125 [Psychrobacillus sp. FJAT-51614]|uniref:Uncharacterized protein n=1 Tax=Psychrobacillus mangrovi TaxID=3117745 RepID=A0ABU8F6Z1_9BACI